MHKKFEINGTKIKGGSESGRKVVTKNSKSDLSLDHTRVFQGNVLHIINGHISSVHEEKK